MNIQTSLFKQINESFFKSSAALLIAAGFCIAFLPETKFAFSPNASVSVENNIIERDDAFDKKFREGRDLIDKEEWAKAAEKFNEVISKYPDTKSADAALYWLAFCYKKQKQFKETDATLDRLLKDFPASSWADDARVMKLEIAAPLGRWVVSTPGVANSSLPSGSYVAMFPDNQVKGGANVTPASQIYGSYTTFGETNTTSKTPLDREDEFKIAAFQSLLSADPNKAIEAMSGILKSDSKASETLKLEVLRVIRRTRASNGYSSPLLATTVSTTNPVNNQSTSLLRESLVKSFQNESNIKIRREIIYTLASLKDEQSVNYLAQLYASETDREAKKAIINAFGSSWGSSGFYFTDSYNSVQTPALAAADKSQSQGIEFAKLLEIVRTEKDVELRRLALNNLQRFGEWETNGQIVETLIRIYDSETDEDFKKTIVQSFGKIKQSTASKKLLDIARNDKSDKLRLEAIYALRNNNSPEALKFLEELIK